MAKVSKCDHCRQKVVHRKRYTRAKDGSWLAACTCGKQWVVHKRRPGWRASSFSTPTERAG